MRFPTNGTDYRGECLICWRLTITSPWINYGRLTSNRCWVCWKFSQQKQQEKKLRWSKMLSRKPNKSWSCFVRYDIVTIIVDFINRFQWVCGFMLKFTTTRMQCVYYKCMNENDVFVYRLMLMNGMNEKKCFVLIIQHSTDSILSISFCFIYISKIIQSLNGKKKTTNIRTFWHLAIQNWTSLTTWLSLNENFSVWVDSFKIVWKQDYWYLHSFL